MRAEYWIEWAVETIWLTAIPTVVGKILLGYATDQSAVITNLQNAPCVDVGPELKTLLEKTPGSVLPYVAIRGYPVKDLRGVQSLLNLKGLFNVFSNIRCYLNVRTSDQNDLVREIIDGSAPFGLKGAAGMIVAVTPHVDADLNQWNPAQFFKMCSPGEILKLSWKMEIPTVGKSYPDLTVVGRLVIPSEGIYMIVPSSQPHCPFVITSSIESTMKKLCVENAVVSVCAGVFLSIGIVFSLKQLWRLWKLWKDAGEREDEN